MKKIFVVFVFVLLFSFVYAAPFGLEIGMTIDEIAAECEVEPEFVDDGIYLVTPLKKHPLFSTYAVYVHENVGLYQIRAISDFITCNKYGTELQNAFNNVKDRVAKTYGNPRVINKVDPAISTYLKEDEYWFYTLEEGSRQLSAIWGEKVELSDGLVSVALDCVTNSGVYDGNGYLVLYYVFFNAETVEDEQDEVF